MADLSTVLDNLGRIPAPVLPAVPAQVLLDAARAYVDANAAINRIGTNDALQEAAARAVVTSQLLQAAVATAYASGHQEGYDAGWTDSGSLIEQSGFSIEGGVRAHITRFDVCAHPDPESINYHSYVITVEYRGSDRWAVLHHRYCLGATGEWSYESIPSEREDEWLAEHRFALNDAIKHARAAASKLVVNGHTAAQVWEWEKARRAERGDQP